MLSCTASLPSPKNAPTMNGKAMIATGARKHASGMQATAATGARTIPALTVSTLPMNENMSNSRVSMNLSLRCLTREAQA
jgi:hypothetical protein